MSSVEFCAKIEMSRSIEKLMASEVVRFTTSAVEALAMKYNFSASDAIELLGLADVEVARKTGGPGGKAKTTKEPKAKRDVPKCVLPFCGTCVEGWCEGVRLNHGLYTQCQMEKDGDSRFCKTCNKQASANATGKPNYGDIQSRMEAGVNYRDPKGKQPQNYGNVMEKLNITRETAMEEAAKYGLVIPEDQFAVIKRKQGRPKTKVTTSDTESEGEPKVPKKRGRPKKVKTVVEQTNSGDDLIANLVAAAKGEPAKTKSDEAKSDEAKSDEAKSDEAKPKKAGRPKVVRTPEEEAAHKAKLAENRKKKAAAKKEQEAAEAKLAAEAKKAAEEAAKKETELVVESLDEDDDDEDGELDVESFTWEGKTYWKDTESNRLFDQETEDLVGKFNEETQKIEPVEEE